MLDLFFEGFTSLRFACTFAVVLIGLGPVLTAGSAAWVTAATFVLTAALVGWARAAGLWFSAPGVALLVSLAVLLGAASVVARRANAGLATGLPAGVAAGLTAGWLWLPCVGEHLAQPLNEASVNPLGTLLPLVTYLVGAGLPLLVVAAIPLAVPVVTRVRDHAAVRTLGLVLAMLVALAVAAGSYTDLVARLAPESAIELAQQNPELTTQNPELVFRIAPLSRSM